MSEWIMFFVGTALGGALTVYIIMKIDNSSGPKF